MATSASDRLANLFGSSNLPPPPTPDQPTFAEQELASMAERSANWKIPNTAQYPRKIQGGRPKPAAGGDIYTSSEDEDDYVASFQKKPKMISAPANKKSHKQPPRKMPETGAFGYQNAKIPKKGAIAYLEYGNAEEGTNEPDGEVPVVRGLPEIDDQGNPATGHFCQFGLVAKFPYKYMIDENDRVSRHFFANQRFYERTWDLYYLHAPQSLCSSRPLILIPYSQVKALIDEISTVFKAEVNVPSDPFTLSFFEDGTPQPVSLGTTMSRGDINDLQDSIPPAPKGHGEPPSNSTKALDHSFAAFKTKVERAQAAEKRKKTAMKKKKANDRFLNIQDWCKQLRRAQRHFGIRPEPFQIEAPPPGMSWEEQEVFVKQQEKKSGVTLDPLDLSKPAPHNFQMCPIIVSIDIESYERQHDIITEVGISTLDTLDLVGIPPGEGGEEWMKQIRSRHFRVKGREHYVNRDFCIGDGNAFQFGESEWVDLDVIGNRIDSCFEWPFSVQYKHDGKLKFHSATWEEAITKANKEVGNLQVQAVDPSGPANGSYDDEKVSIVTHVNGNASASSETANGQVDTDNTIRPTFVQKGPRERTFLLTGHDIGSDLTYLSKLNSAVFSSPRDGETKYPPVSHTPDASDARAVKGAEIVRHILEALDTGTLYKVLLKEQNNRSLTSIMADIGRSAFYSHNGGNDARYTLEALIGLVIKSRLMDDEVEAAKKKDVGAAGGNVWEAEKERRISDKVEAAKHEVEEEMEAWERAGASGTSPKSEQNEFEAAVEQANTNGNGAVNDPWTFTPFTKTLEATHAAQDKKKKSAETKRREWEIKVKKEDGIEGPCDWAVGGKDGVGK